MKIFDAYSQYYDLLYRDKNYTDEVAYLESLINKHSANARTILDLGCGTGKHAQMLAEKGYSVHGVDASATMLSQAELRKKERAQASQLSFSQGDIRTIRLDKTFDVVTSLFHVVSYLTKESDLHETFDTAQKHLKSGGLFIFDFWYGPAVLHEPLPVTVRHIEDEQIKVTRIAERTHFSEENKIDVSFTMYVKNKSSNLIEEFNELHSMRYLFKPEVAALCNAHGFDLVVFEEWLTAQAPVKTSWGVCAVGKKR